MLVGAPSHTRPLLLIDVDGVISLFGFEGAQGRVPSDVLVHYVDGHPHLVSRRAGLRLTRLAETFEPVWCTGWEGRAAEHLPPLLHLGAAWPWVGFAGARPARGSHWKLQAINAYAGPDRPLAWIDDGHTAECAAWARARPGATKLLTTGTAVGLTDAEADELQAWAAALKD